MTSLFKDFKHATAAQWKEQMLKDLKGESYENLIWHNENSFDVEPFYTAENLKTKYTPAFTHADWDICVDGKQKKGKELNDYLLRNLQRGASAIMFEIGANEVEIVLKDIDLTFIRASFFLSADVLAEVSEYLAVRYPDQGYQISFFPKGINTIKDLEKWHTTCRSLNLQAGVNAVCIDVLPWHNRNCTASYEIAIVYALLAEHLEYLAANKYNLQGDVVVRTGVSSDYFIQIAKLRAIRRLWRLFQKEFKISNELRVITETSLTNKSLSDSYNNLLRTTVEGMAAVAGGCDQLVVNDFDVLFARDPKLSERMSVNQQLILKEESYLNKMADIACGSYFIDSHSGLANIALYPLVIAVVTSVCSKIKGY